MEQYLLLGGSEETKGMKMLVCRACLTSDVALHNIYTNGLTETLESLIGVPLQSTDDMPPYICDVCVHLLRKFERYRAMCRRAMQILQRIQLDDESKTHQLCNNQQQEFLERPLMFSQRINIDIFENEIDNAISFTINPDEDKANAVFVDKHCELDAVDQIPSGIKCENNEEELNKIEALDNDVKFISDDEMSSGEKDITVEPKRIVRKRKIKTEDNVETAAKVKKGAILNIIDINDIIGLAQKNNDVVVNPCKKERVSNNIKMNKQDLNGKKCKSHVDPRVSKGNPKRRSRKNEATSDTDFARMYNFEVKCLTKEEQKQEMEIVKKKYEHLPYQCQKCYRGYKQQQKYESHMLAHDPGTGDFECDICGLRLKTATLRSIHLTRRHNYLLICKTCGKKNYYRDVARQHYLTVHKQDVIRCEICDKTFKKSGNYSLHMRIMHQKNSLACQICRKEFTGSRGVHSHMYLQHRQAVQCHSCNMYFDNKAALAKHFKNSINGACASGTSSCFTCGEGFNTLEEAIEHGYQHVAEGSACSKRNNIKSPANTCLRRQIKQLGGRMPVRARKVPTNNNFMCETCGRALPSPAALRAHKLLHTGEKPHRCTYCPKTFRLKSALNTHLLGHTDERPYRCQLCPKAFRQGTHLRNHLRIHTLEKPFECEICHKMFSLKENMRVHVKTVHEGLPPRRKKKDK